MATQSTDAVNPNDVWFQIIVGVAFFACATYLYFDLAEFERLGGERNMISIFAALYNLFGKWGVVAPVALTGFAMFWSGIRNRRQLTSSGTASVSKSTR